MHAIETQSQLLNIYGFDAVFNDEFAMLMMMLLLLLMFNER